MVHLHRVAYGLPGTLGSWLPSLTHLRLSSVELHERNYDWTLSVFRLRALTHLCVYDTPVSSCPDFGPVAAQLELVALDTVLPDLISAFTRYSAWMVHLHSLIVGGVAMRLLTEMLSRLPRPLDVLDLVASPAFVGAASTVLASFERNDVATSRLQLIRLPQSDSAVEWCESHELRGVIQLVSEVASAAEVRGARVEWV